MVDDEETLEDELDKDAEGLFPNVMTMEAATQENQDRTSTHCAPSTDSNKSQNTSKVKEHHGLVCQQRPITNRTLPFQDPTYPPRKNCQEWQGPSPPVPKQPVSKPTYTAANCKPNCGTSKWLTQTQQMTSLSSPWLQQLQ
jgi:hypothetical protein